jgi:hypothetical protein
MYHPDASVARLDPAHGSAAVALRATAASQMIDGLRMRN